MREIDKILSFEDFKNKINKLDRMANTDPAQIAINFPKTEGKAGKFFYEFFRIADGNPDWYV